MSSFTRADLRAVPGKYDQGRQVYELLDDFTFYVGNKETGLSVTAKAGFLTDLASWPAFINRMFPRLGELFMKSVIVHDRLRKDLQFTKVDTDCCFLTAMYAEETPRWLRWAAFWAVRRNNSRRGAA